MWALHQALGGLPSGPEQVPKVALALVQALALERELALAQALALADHPPFTMPAVAAT